MIRRRKLQHFSQRKNVPFQLYNLSTDANIIAYVLMEFIRESQRQI